MPPTRTVLALLAGAAVLLSGCSATVEIAERDRPGAPVSEPLEPRAADASPDQTGDRTAAADAAEEAAADDPCAPHLLPVAHPGKLTVATSAPAYAPWFKDNDPTNGKGFESAVTYALAAELGFTEQQVLWVNVPFDVTGEAATTDFDFNVNQISITPEREQVADFSEGYYAAAQAVVALEGTRAARARTLADLARLRLGAQPGTTSWTALRDRIAPKRPPYRLADTAAAKRALTAGRVDAFLTDLPSAWYIADAEIPRAAIVGQLQPAAGEQEEFGLLFEQGSPLVPCVDRAIEALRSSGTLARLEERWLSQAEGVRELR